MRYLLTVLFSFFLLSLSAKKHYDFSESMQKAYQQVLELRFGDAQLILEKEKKENPDNLIPYYIDNYIDFFTVFIGENQRDFDNLEDNEERRLELMETGDKDSPYHLFIQAEIRLQWALARLKFDEYFSTYRGVKKAYKLLEQNEEKFPDFIANKKSLGMLHAMVGNIPDNYQWGVEFVSGVQGSIDLGKKEIESVLKYAKHNEFIFENEVVVLYSFLLLHLGNDQESAWNFIHNSDLDPAKNPLACFVKANIAMRTGRNDIALKLLKNRPKGTAYQDFHYLEFLLGLAKLRNLDYSGQEHLEYYCNNFKGRNYIKESYQKLAWISILKNDPISFQYFMGLCKFKGQAGVGADKKAQKAAEEGEVPNTVLLKARLLFDGGYYQKALNELNGYTSMSFSSTKERLEYTYRRGRIGDRIGDTNLAIQNYSQTMEEGANLPYYFACNSGLKLGELYERERMFDKAEAAYKACLAMYPNEYRTELHIQAKAGINRVKNK